MNGKKVSRIAAITAIIAVVSLLIAGLIGISSGVFRGIPGKVKAFSVSGALPLEGTRNITIMTTNGYITIRETSGDEITASLHGTLNSLEERPRLEVRRQGDTAEIRFERNQRYLQIGRQPNNAVLEVGIPNKYAGKLSVEGVSSDISLQNHAYSELALKTVSGDIESDGALAVIGSVDAHSISGDVALSFSKMPGSIAVKTVSGDVHLAVPSNAQYTLETHSVSGDVTSDSSATNLQPGGSKGIITANTVSGNIGISRNGGI